jgi:HK97 family phage major capsid protein
MTPEQIRDMQSAFAAFKAANESALAEVKKYGSSLGETTERLKKAESAIEDLEAMLRRKSGYAGEPTGTGRPSRAKDLFFDALRGKSVDHSEMLSKGLLSANDASGGVLAPGEYVSEIISGIVEFSPIRQYATIRSTTRMGISMPKKRTSAGAVWIGAEGSTRTETTNPGFGLVEIRTHELFAQTNVSRVELEDSVFELEGFLRGEFSEQFGKSEGTSFVVGTGIGQPEGLMTNSSVQSVNSGNASQLTADAVIGLYYALPTAYASQGAWVLNRNTLRDIRRLKDGAGNYLWSAAGFGASALVPGAPATILGRPYVESPDMTDVSANAFPILFGDLRRGYLILDRVVIEVLTDPYSGKATGMVEFSARKRVGGQVILPEAIKLLKIAA